MNLTIFIFIVLSTLFLLAAFSPTLSESEGNSYEYDDLETIPELSEAYLHDVFNEWMVKHGRNYSTTNEMIKRREIFKKNVHHIRKFNSEGHSYTKGINQFTDYDDSEFVSCNTDPPHILNLSSKRIPYNMSYEVDNFQPAFDWRDRGVVTPVREQGQCGSCWAFAAAAAIESAWKIHHGELFVLSPQMLIDCVENTNGCSGGSVTKSFDYVADRAIVKEQQYPYVGKKGTCHDQYMNSVITVEGYEYPNDITEGDVIGALLGGPLVTTIYSGPALHAYRGGIFDGPCGDVAHSALIVGYGSESNGQKYWIVKNSWGRRWGEQGYLRINRTMRSLTTRGYGRCGVLDTLYPLVSDHPPRKTVISYENNVS